MNNSRSASEGNGSRGSRAALLLLSVVIVLLATGIVGRVLAESPVHPTNYLSTVTSSLRDVEGVEFAIAGGDAFLTVEVEPGHTASVPGYFDEGYLLIAADGEVELNTSSPAYYINQDRWGEVPVPAGVDANDPPTWSTIRDDGTYAWHDHRVHWMSLDRPPIVSGDERQLIFPWEVPFTLDGSELIVSGELEWIPSLSPIPAILAGVIAIGPLVLWGLANARARGALALGGWFSVAAVETAHLVSAQPATRSFPFGVVIAVGGLAAFATWLYLRGEPREGSWAYWVLTAGLFAWSIGAFSALTHPVLPAGLPDLLQRLLTAIALWTGLGLVFSGAAGVWWPNRVGSPG